MRDRLLLFLLIAAGGAAGAVLRFVVSGWVQHCSGSAVYPFGTVVVNLIGCLLIGLLSGLAERHAFPLSGEARSFLIIGVLGGFTTFSSFGNETFNLFSIGRPSLAMLNAGSQVVLGVGLVWLGRLAASFL
jgi:CrcB protein